MVKCHVPIWVGTSNGNLDIVSNSKVLKVKYPIDPYFYSFTQHFSEGVDITKLSRFELSKKKEVEVYKHSYKNMFDYIKATRMTQEVGKDPNGLSLNQLVYIDKPDFLKDYANTDELKCMCLDIEVLSEEDKSFPTPDKFPIFAIGVNVDGKYKEFYSDGEDDTQILKEFLQYFSEVDPDVISGYNLKKFDLPYLVERCKINNLDITCLKRVKNYWNEFEIFAGRVVMDLFWEVKSDLSVRALPNHTLKTVGKHFGYDVKDLPKSIKENLKAYYLDANYRKQISEYLFSDVEICVRMLVDNYLLGKVLLAENVGVPLDDVIRYGDSFVPKIFMHRLMNERKYISIVQNKNRDYYYGKYEGAKVRCYKESTYVDSKVFHYDFSSMYPSIMMTFNLSPDTIFFVSNEESGIKFWEYDSMTVEELISLFTIVDEGESILFKFPDKGDSHIRFVTVRIMKKKGFLIEGLESLYKKRQELKAEYVRKKNENLPYAVEFSKQYMYKTQINSTYGVQGSEFTFFTEYLIGPVVTAIGRFLISNIERFLSSDTVCEIDTDGLYSTKDVDVKTIDTYINDLIKSHFSNLISKSYISIDREEFKHGYFYKAKNYILVNKFDGLKIKGNSMKSSRNCNIVREVFKKVVQQSVVERKNIYLLEKELFDLSKYQLEDYALSVTISKDLALYKSTGCLSVNLGTQLKKFSGEDPAEGREIQYVITKNKENRYKLLDEVKSAAELDLEYYQSEVSKCLEKFGWVQPAIRSQTNLNKFF